MSAMDHETKLEQVGDAEYRVPDNASPPLPVVILTAAILTAIVIIGSVFLWRQVEFFPF